MPLAIRPPFLSPVIPIAVSRSAPPAVVPPPAVDAVVAPSLAAGPGVTPAVASSTAAVFSAVVVPLRFP